MAVCLICGKSYISLGTHVNITHKVKVEDYAKEYLGLEHNCKMCGKETGFLSLARGFSRHCSQKCAMANPEVIRKLEATNLERYCAKNVYASEYGKQKIKETCLERYGVEYTGQAEVKKEKTRETMLDKYGVPGNFHRQDVRDKSKATLASEEYRNKLKWRFSKVSEEEWDRRAASMKKTKQEKCDVFELENNCIAMSKLDRYWDGFLDVEKITYMDRFFIPNYELPRIEKYLERKNEVNSPQELYILNNLLEVTEEIEVNSFRIDKFLLDFYIPSLNLGIEYNSTYWHSTIRQVPEFHLNKSILFRENGIRLIHIYEFEDLNKQLELVKELIRGNDLFPKDDFNKNNFGEIPEPEIIYSKDYIIYGAGKLKR